jgi:hypothetical protein
MKRPKLSLHAVAFLAGARSFGSVTPARQNPLEVDWPCTCTHGPEWHSITWPKSSKCARGDCPCERYAPLLAGSLAGGPCAKLEGLVAGELQEADAEAVRDHLPDCQPCQAQLPELLARSPAADREAQQEATPRLLQRQLAFLAGLLESAALRAKQAAAISRALSREPGAKDLEKLAGSLTYRAEQVHAQLSADLSPKEEPRHE